MNERPLPDSTDDVLMRSEKRYRALVEATSQAVWLWSPHDGASDLETSNRWWQQLTGQSIEEQIADPSAWLEYVHPDDRAEVERSWRHSTETGIQYDIQYRVRGQKGAWHYIKARGVPVKDNCGKVQEWVGTLEDVTRNIEIAAERERLFNEAESERERIEQVFRHAPSFMAVLRGPDHIFEKVNDRYIELIGGRHVLGLPVREALPEVVAQGYCELLDQVYESGEPYVAADKSVTLRNPTGTTLRILQFVYQPLFGPSGKVSGIIVQGTDLTERRQEQERLARITVESEWQRRMYETALSNTADFIYLFDTNGRFNYVNKALLDLLGKESADVVGRNFFELEYPKDLAERLQRQIQEVICTGESRRDETPYTSARGTRTYEYIFVPVLGLDGSIEAVAGSTRDITDRKKTEESVRESEMRHRALLTATSDVIYRMNGDWSEMQPLDGRDLVASSVVVLDDWMQRNTPPFEHARIRAAIDRAIELKSTFELEHQVYRTNGTLGWTFSRAVPILDAAGEVVEWFGAASDVTRRKQAEGELQDIRSRMEAALNAGAIGTWSWDVQADQFHGDLSFSRLFGVDPSVVAGGELSAITSVIHPDDLERVKDLIAIALESGSQYEATYRLVLSDGTSRWVTARGKVERDSAGVAIRFPGVVIDVTDWKQAEIDLTRVTIESERRKRLYETILSNTPDLAYVFDLDHRFVYANDVLLQMWGRTWDEAIGKTCLELGYEPWHAEMHNQEIDQIKATRRPIRGEVPFHGSFGPRIYEYIFVPVLGPNGEVEAVAGTTRDVTERKDAEEALRDADRKKDDFLALLAHELRNPLAPIRNGLQIMRLAGDDLNVVANARSIMERQLAHMVRLIDDLLDVSRITRNKMELRRSRVPLSEIIENAVEAAGPVIHEQDQQLTVTLPSEALWMDADLTRLAQVFSNLLTNSAKYTARGGKIWLTAERAGNMAIVSVKDTGIGIPASALPTIFDMFSQVGRSVERSSGGLGIGLALVRGLVEMHGGSVSVTSGEGIGSTFTVSLPTAALEPIMQTNPPSDTKPLRTRRRVLVVDDNEDGAESLAMMLRLLGNEVSTAHDGLEAVAKAAAFRPDLIIMDVGLPRISGLEATQRIRQQPWGRAVKIIALTGWGQDNDRQRSKEAGCDGHLVKPVMLADLEQIISEITAK
jgi:PAS domain S-box-containing protein